MRIVTRRSLEMRESFHSDIRKRGFYEETEEKVLPDVVEERLFLGNIEERVSRRWEIQKPASSQIPTEERTFHSARPIRGFMSDESLVGETFNRTFFHADDGNEEDVDQTSLPSSCFVPVRRNT